MKRFASVTWRAVLAALLMVSVFAGVASADPGAEQGANVDTQGQDEGGLGGWLQEIRLPEDPGIQ